MLAFQATIHQTSLTPQDRRQGHWQPHLWPQLSHSYKQQPRPSRSSATTHWGSSFPDGWRLANLSAAQKHAWPRIQPFLGSNTGQPCWLSTETATVKATKWHQTSLCPSLREACIPLPNKQGWVQGTANQGVWRRGKDKASLSLFKQDVTSVTPLPL